MKLLENIKSILKSKLVESSSVTDLIDEEGGYISATNQGGKGFLPVTRDVQMKRAFQLYLKNGLAKAIISLYVEFVYCKEMMTPEISFGDENGELEDKAKKIISNFVKKNKFESKFKRYLTDLYINGMLILPVFENDINGGLTLGFIDPQFMDKAVINAYDVTDVQTIKLIRDFAGTTKELTVIKDRPALQEYFIDESISSKCFYFAINNVSNQPEGISELYANIEEIKNFKSYIDNTTEASELLNLFILDVTLDGYSAEEIKKWKKENPLPRRPARFIHNNKVKQEAVTPGLRANDNSNTIKALKNSILGNYNLPPMWFADGQDANRAIAVEQGTPIYKRISDKRDFALDMLSEIYTYVLKRANEKLEGFSLSTTQLDDMNISFKCPSIETKNLQIISEALEKVTNSLISAENAGYISKETAQKVYLTEIQRFGSEIDIDEEVTKIEAQNKNADNNASKNIIPLNNNQAANE